MIRAGLAGGVRGAGGIGRLFGEESIRPLEVTVDFIRGDMVESETVSARLVEPVPVRPRHFQQRVGADDVGLDERCRTVDGAIHVAFRRQVHHCVRTVRFEDSRQRLPLDNVDLLEVVARIVGDRCQRFQVACIGELVDIHHFVVGVGNDMADHRRADKAGAACYKYFHDIEILRFLGESWKRSEVRGQRSENGASLALPLQAFLFSDFPGLTSSAFPFRSWLFLRWVGLQSNIGRKGDCLPATFSRHSPSALSGGWAIYKPDPRSVRSLAARVRA